MATSERWEERDTLARERRRDNATKQWAEAKAGVVAAKEQAAEIIADATQHADRIRRSAALKVEEANKKLDDRTAAVAVMELDAEETKAEMLAHVVKEVRREAKKMAADLKTHIDKFIDEQFKEIA
jgi:hypothetical protein